MFRFEIKTKKKKKTEKSKNIETFECVNQFCMS